MGDSKTIADHYPDVKKFTLTLTAAELLAEGAAQEEFVTQVRERFEKWGMKSFMTEAQHRWLERISET